MIVEVELGVVDPDLMAVEGNPPKLATELGQISEPGLDHLSNPPEVHSAFRGGERAGLEDQRHRRMRALSGGLAGEMGGALLAQSLIEESRHFPILPTSGPRTLVRPAPSSPRPRSLPPCVRPANPPKRSGPRPPRRPRREVRAPDPEDDRERCRAGRPHVA